jgi:FMN reductase
MAIVLSVCGSPAHVSRTAYLLGHVGALLGGLGHDVVHLQARSLPAEALLYGDIQHPAIVRTAAQFAAADAVVVGTPIYKAAYSGLLKSLLDVLPQYALAGKYVLPIATGGSAAHVLAIDYALRPVLNSMGAGHIAPGRFVLDRLVTIHADGTVAIEPEAQALLLAVVEEFAAALTRRRPGSLVSRAP